MRSVLEKLRALIRVSLMGAMQYRRSGPQPHSASLSASGERQSVPSLLVSVSWASNAHTFTVVVGSQ